MTAINYARLPEHMQEHARAYIEHGLDPGSFLLAILCNKLVEAYRYADDKNAACIRDWVMWLYNDCPSRAWGSLEKVDLWIAHGGMTSL